jgi:hypothetical protein
MLAERPVWLCASDPWRAAGQWFRMQLACGEHGWPCCDVLLGQAVMHAGRRRQSEGQSVADPEEQPPEIPV